MLFSTFHTAALIGLAEMGDRSQLVTVALATRHRAASVLAGALLAFGALNLVAVLVGSSLGQFVSSKTSLTLAGLFMLGFAIWTWRDEVDDMDAQHPRASHPLSARPILGTAFALAASEFGDKTQFAVASLAANTSPVSVWVGATLALMGTTALAVLVGRSLTDAASPAVMRKVAAGFFALTGIVLLTLPWW